MLPRLPLAHLPTPLEPLPRLSAALGVRLWVKRDDQTGLAGGGNKTRKLEFLLAEALRQECDTVLTVGGPQSNHCRQTAAAAARLGLRCVLVLGGHAAQARPGGNLLLDRLLGAELVWAGDQPRDGVEGFRSSRERARDLDVRLALEELQKTPSRGRLVVDDEGADLIHASGREE